MALRDVTTARSSWAASCCCLESVRPPAFRSGGLECLVGGECHDFQRPFLGHGFHHRCADACGLGQFRQAHGKAFGGDIQNPLALRRHAADFMAGAAIGDLPLCFFKGAGAAQHHAQHIALGLDVIIGQPIDELAVRFAHGGHVETADDIAELGAFGRLGFQGPDNADQGAGAEGHKRHSSPPPASFQRESGRNRGLPGPAATAHRQWGGNRNSWLWNSLGREGLPVLYHACHEAYDRSTDTGSCPRDRLLGAHPAGPTLAGAGVSHPV